MNNNWRIKLWTLIRRRQKCEKNVKILWKIQCNNVIKRKTKIQLRYFGTESQMKLASKMRQCISTLPIISSFMKFCVSRTFCVERHLEVVLEVLQVVGSKFLFFKLVENYHWKTHWKKYDDCGRYFTFWTLEKNTGE